MNLNELAKTVHQANIKWWQNIDTGEPIKRNPYELLALVVSELSEALEGERKNIMDDKLPHRKMAEVEMADAKIRLLDFAAGFGYELISINAQSPITDNKGAAIFDLTYSTTFIGELIHDKFTGFGIGYQISVVIAYIESYCQKHGYDLQGAFDEKMIFNASREDHRHEARRIAGGKQF